MRQFKKNVFLVLLSFTFVGFTGKEKYIELNGAMNGRGSARFTQSSHNILFTIGENTKAEILSYKKFHSGNYGLRVRVASGPHKNKVIWVYHNVDRPTMALYESCPRSWGESTVASCNSAKSPERANASIAVKPTPATRNEPEEVELPKTSILPIPKIIAPAKPVLAATPAPAAKKGADSVSDKKSATAPVAAKKGTDSASQKSETAADCRDCSSAKNKSPVNPTFVEQLVETTSKSALTGAYRVMASMYQSCHVLNLPPIHLGKDDQMKKYVRRSGRARVVSPQNLDEIANTHYYLKDAPEPRNPSCKDMSQTPPLYFYGGKATVRNGELNIFAKAPTRGGAQTVGLDCSGFVSSAFSVSGLKLKPSTTNASQNYASSRILNSFTEKNSCFNRPSFTKNSTIQAGDVVAWNGHTFMIDTVGKDPFGIEKAKAKGTFASSISACNRFQPPRSDLDFTIIQSTGAGNLPAMRIEAKNYGGTSVRSYLNLAIQACKAQFTNAQGSDFVAMPERRNPVALLRHKGSSDPKCSFSPDKIPRLAGEECTQGCFKESL